MRPIDDDEEGGTPMEVPGVAPLPTVPTGIVVGLVLTGLATAVVLAVHHWFPGVPALTAAVFAGIAVANLTRLPAAAGPGFSWAGKHLLRAGVVLLGLRLSVASVGALGVRGVALVLAVVAGTFVGTLWLGRQLRVGPDLALLVATGFSICGASAVAAVSGIVRARDEDTAYAVGLVTLCGTAAIVLLPALNVVLELPDRQFGLWVGSSVHDVGQVLAAADTGGQASVAAATVVKLTRVALLGPLVLAISLSRERTEGRTVPVVPLFVVGFLAAVAVRSTGVVPGEVLDAVASVETAVLTAAVFALGTGVRVAQLRRLGGRPLALAAASWAMIACGAYAGVRLLL